MKSLLLLPLLVAIAAAKPGGPPPPFPPPPKHGGGGGGGGGGHHVHGQGGQHSGGKGHGHGSSGGDMSGGNDMAGGADEGALERLAKMAMQLRQGLPEDSMSGPEDGMSGPDDSGPETNEVVRLLRTYLRQGPGQHNSGRRESSENHKGGKSHPSPARRQEGSSYSDDLSMDSFGSEDSGSIPEEDLPDAGAMARMLRELLRQGQNQPKKPGSHSGSKPGSRSRQKQRSVDSQSGGTSSPETPDLPQVISKLLRNMGGRESNSKGHDHPSSGSRNH